MNYEIKVERADSEVISLCEESYSFYGGAHGFADYETHTYDMQSGKEVNIDEIVTDFNSLAKAIEDRMMEDEDFSDVIKFYQNDSDITFAEYLKQNYITEEYGFSVPWTLTDEGLHIWFSDYMLGGYAFGARNIVLPYEKNKALFKDSSFFKDTHKDNEIKELTDVKENLKEEMDLSDYCRDEGNFMLTDFTEVAGTYLSKEGYRFEIYENGNYSDYLNDTSGNGEPAKGFLLGNPGGFNMHGYPIDASDRQQGDLNYGSIHLIDKGEIDVLRTWDSGGGRRYYYSEADTIRFEGEETGE